MKKKDEYYTWVKFGKGENKFDEDCRRKVGSEWANKTKKETVNIKRKKKGCGYKAEK